MKFSELLKRELQSIDESIFFLLLLLPTLYPQVEIVLLSDKCFNREHQAFTMLFYFILIKFQQVSHLCSVSRSTSATCSDWVELIQDFPTSSNTWVYSRLCSSQTHVAFINTKSKSTLQLLTDQGHYYSSRTARLLLTPR